MESGRQLDLSKSALYELDFLRKAYQSPILDDPDIIKVATLRY